MSRTFGRSRQELRSLSMAKALVKALVAIEYCNDDVEPVMDDMEIYAGKSEFTANLSVSQHRELQHVVQILKNFYCTNKGLSESKSGDPEL